MNSKLSLVLAVCLIGTVSCGTEDLYKQVFGETSPKLDRAVIIRILNDLQSSYQGDPEKKSLIDEVLKKSQISEDKCGEFFIIAGVTGPAKDFLEETKRSQGELCKNLWQKSALQSIASLNKEDETFADTLFKSLVGFNGGEEFLGSWLNNWTVVKGFRRYLEQQSKTKLSTWTGRHKFIELYDSYLYKPCEHIVDSLDSVLKRYVDLVLRFGPMREPSVDPIALSWVKRGLICQQIRGYGYSSNKGRNFRADFFYNLRKGNL